MVLERFSESSHCSCLVAKGLSRGPLSATKVIRSGLPPLLLARLGSVKWLIDFAMALNVLVCLIGGFFKKRIKKKHPKN